MPSINRTRAGLPIRAIATTATMATTATAASAASAIDPSYPRQDAGRLSRSPQTC